MRIWVQNLEAKKQTKNMQQQQQQAHASLPQQQQQKDLSGFECKKEKEGFKFAIFNLFRIWVQTWKPKNKLRTHSSNKNSNKNKVSNSPF